MRRAIKSFAITVVTGFRRVGKTSLIKAATYALPRVYIDARKFESFQYLTYEIFIEELKASVSRFVAVNRRVLDYLKAVKGVKVLGLEIEFDHGRLRPLLTSILEAMDLWARDNGEKLVVIIDEAQELVKLRGYDIIPAIAYAYDNLRNLSFVFAGSKIGLLYRFLKVEDPSSPLYGRYVERIELKPLSREKAIEFLREGFEYHGVKVDESFLNKAVDRVDGVVGWLAYLGLRVVSKGYADPAIINEVLEEASKIAVNEFCNFVNAMGSKRYVEIMKAVGEEEASWSEIKRFLELKLGTRIYDSELARLLRNLIDNGFIEKKDGAYIIPDPILRHASKNLRC